MGSHAFSKHVVNAAWSCIPQVHLLSFLVASNLQSHRHHHLVWHASYCETPKFNCHTPTNHEVELDFFPPTTTIVKFFFILSFQTWIVAQQTLSGQMGFKVHTWQPNSNFRLTSTPRTRNSTSMGLGPNNFPRVVTTTIIMTISVQFEKPTLQMSPCYNAYWHGWGKCTLWWLTF